MCDTKPRAGRRALGSQRETLPETDAAAVFEESWDQIRPREGRLMPNRAVRRKREAALAKARRKAEAAVALLAETDEDDPMYHERRVFAEAYTGVVGVMEAKIREDA